jgi:hypothetical protein
MSRGVDVRRVHWYEGLPLEPAHFVRQDEFVESLALWHTRFLTAPAGLAGTGQRGASDWHADA